MLGELLKFSVKEVAVGILLSVLLIGGGVAAIVAFVPRSAGGEVAPPIPPTIAPPVIAETATVTVPIPPVVVPPTVVETETIFARLELNQFEGGMAVAGCGTDCEHEAGWTTKLIATPNKGYEFLQWVCSRSCTDFDIQDSQAELLVDSDITINPFFLKVADVVRLHLNQSQGGTVIADCGTDCSDIPGWQATVTAMPNPGYEFVSWNCSTQHCPSENPLVLEIRSDTNVTPIFRVELRADDFTVAVGASSPTWLNPLLHVYDPGEQGSDGVDVDRNTLQIISVSTTSGNAEIVDDGKAVLYTPASSGIDYLTYTVQTSAQGIAKMASGLVTVNPQGEKFAENLTQLNSLLQRHFDAGTAASVRANFRFRDGLVTNQDLEIVRYFASEGFSDDSVKLIMDLAEPLSPLRNLDQYSLTKLNSIEKSLYQNPVFVNNPHGTANWPPEYAKIMKQASFIIPSRIAVIDGLKHIYYDKLVIDEIFEQLGGEYTGIFSRGQDYSPFYVFNEDADEEQLRYYADRASSFLPGSRGVFGLYVFDGGRAYLDAIENRLFHWNELVINFSILATLDSVNYTLGTKLANKNDAEIFFSFDHHSDYDKQGVVGTFGKYGYVIPWDLGTYTNQETNNVYNLARNIIGLNVESELEGVFRIFDWLIKEKGHQGGSPYFPNGTSDFTIGNSVSERNRLLNLPNDAYFPAAYNFIEKNRGGIYLSGSSFMPGHITGAFRSLGISSEQFQTNIVNPDHPLNFGASIDYIYPYFAPESRIEGIGNNAGLILLDNVPWFYEGNFPFRNITGAYRNLVPQSRFTTENIQKVIDRELSYTEFFSSNTALQAEYESLIGSPATQN